MKIPIPIKNVLNQSWIYPAFLFFIGFISYIISYPPSGFYWDDWQAVFLYQNYDVNLLRDYFFYDRPFSSWTYEVVFPFLPMKPIVWQFFTMLVRVLGIWLIISAFEKIWEDRKELLRWAGALLLVFPSFTMQSISVAFNQHFITLFFFCFSIYLMVIGVISTKKWRWLFLILANISTIIHIFTMEYFVGLEVIRPIILFFALRKRYPHLTIKRNYLLTAQYYTSFFIILIGFIFWRIQIYPTLINDPITGKDPNTPVYLDLILKDPIKNTIKLANLIIQDSTYLLTQGLLLAIEPTSIRLDAAFYVFSVIVGLIISWFFSFFISSNQTISRIRDYKTPNKIFLLIGICALFFGGLAVWITGRQLLEGKWSDRFSLAPMLGVVLLIMVFIDWLISAKIRKNIILILALGFSIAFQMRTTHSYALDWQNQLEFYWQLYWRIPAVKPGTAFFSANLPSNYSSDYSVGFSLNTLFSNDKNGGELNHWYFDPGGRGFFFNKLEPENDIYYTFRNLSFSGSTSNAIAYMFKPASGCLLLLDKAYEGNPNMDSFHLGLMNLNNPNQIDFSAPSRLPDSNIFGKELSHDWCYYFQKADIERQNSNWDKLLEMMNEAHQLGLQPKSGVERMPELEAVFYLNDWESFVQISSDVYQMSDYLDRFLCTQWNRLETESQMTIPENIRIDLNNIVNCSEPFKQ